MSPNSEGFTCLSQEMNDERMPGKTFAKALFGRNPSVICGVVQGVSEWQFVSRYKDPSIPRDSNNGNWGDLRRGTVRYNMVSHGDERRKRKFILERDETWPVEKYEALLNKFDDSAGR